METFEHSERTTAQIIKYSFSIIIINRSTLAFVGSKSPMRKCPLLLVRVDQPYAANTRCHRNEV